MPIVIPVLWQCPDKKRPMRAGSDNGIGFLRAEDVTTGGFDVRRSYGGVDFQVNNITPGDNHPNSF